MNKGTPCCTKIGLKRGPWRREEDDILSEYIKKEGEGRWRTLPKRAGLLRCGKSCRLRWMNYLRPDVKRGQITPHEEDLIIRLHRLLGNRWALIAGRLPGRTDNEVKNYWNTHISKKMISKGINPKNHKSFNQNFSKSEANVMAQTSAPKNISNPKPKPNALSTAVANTPRAEDKGKGIYKDDAPGKLLNSNEFGMIGFENSPSEEDDDIFSSFLNSLMNEDVSLNQQLNQMDGSHLALDPQVLGYNPLWEAMSLEPPSAAFRNEDEQNAFSSDFNRNL